MTRYEFLLFLHVAAAIVWVGAGFLIAMLIFGAERSGDRVKEAGHHQDVGWLAPRLFIPASMATLVLGVLVVIDGPWSFGDLWIVIGLVGWAISFALGFFYFKPEGERIAGLVAQHGPANAEADRRIRRLNVVDRVQLTILFLVVADMVIKPTGDDPGVLIAGAAILAAVAAMGVASLRGGDHAPAADRG